MKTLKEKVLYFHDFMTNEEETQEEVRSFKREFYENGIIVDEIEATDTPPFEDKKYYDILLFDWGGASFGNSLMRHFCENILEEALEKPSKIYIMVSAFTEDAMKEAMDSFELANGELPTNVFLDIKKACNYIKKI